MKHYDLLQTVEYGGCAAKLPAAALSRALADLPASTHPNLLVSIETHDDAGVFIINDELALIQTTDFFTPVCSDPFTFGQIAAANALSDVYAMGGDVLTVLNIVAFPANVPLRVLREILKGGIEKVNEAGGIVVGGHTIVNDTPVYGLAVTGTIHPGRIITNSAARPGNVLLLTKPLGTGTMMAGKRIGEAKSDHYQAVLESMKQLSKAAVPVMQKYGVACATDITGFGVAGHALKLATASGVTIKIYAERLPVFDGVFELLNLGCIPGACFRNLEYVETQASFAENLNYEHKMLLMDAQTSGGLLICCRPDVADDMTGELRDAGFEKTALIGEVQEKAEKYLRFE
ncbi:MAG TPA: selenide, water dikinase SelD [Bacteroidales bacterium]|nr:selenide, water dikinase SelD [Bacteroidales bacterium]